MLHFFSGFYLRYRQRIIKTSPRKFLMSKKLEPRFIPHESQAEMEAEKEARAEAIEIEAEGGAQEMMGQPERAGGAERAEQPERAERAERAEEEDAFDVVWSVDPISRERLSSSDEAGIRIRQQIYHVPTLLEYLATRDAEDLRDPVSRVLFSEDDLAALDAKAQRLGLRQRAGSVSGQSPEEEKAARCRRKSIGEEILSLETVLGEVVAELAALVEQDQQPRGPVLHAPQSVFAIDAAQSTELALTLLLSQFQDPFEQLKLLSIETFYFNLCSYKEFLRGNPNKPRVDGPHRCLTTITTWLDSFWTEDDRRELDALRGV